MTSKSKCYVHAITLKYYTCIIIKLNKIKRVSYSIVEKVCSSPYQPCNGRLTCTSDKYEYGTTCYPLCNDGYSTDSTKSMVCNGDEWIGIIEPCLGIKTLKYVA